MCAVCIDEDELRESESENIIESEIMTETIYRVYVDVMDFADAIDMFIDGACLFCLHHVNIATAEM